MILLIIILVLLVVIASIKLRLIVATSTGLIAIVRQYIS